MFKFAVIGEALHTRHRAWIRPAANGSDLPEGDGDYIHHKDARSSSRQTASAHRDVRREAIGPCAFSSWPRRANGSGPTWPALNAGLPQGARLAHRGPGAKGPRRRPRLSRDRTGPCSPRPSALNQRLGCWTPTSRSPARPSEATLTSSSIRAHHRRHRTRVDGRPDAPAAHPDDLGKVPES